MTNERADETLEWHKILEPGELDEGRVKTVAVGTRTFAVSHHGGEFGCIDNACPHRAGPLAKGRSRTDGSAARGTATTTRRSPACHPRDSATRPRVHHRRPRRRCLGGPPGEKPVVRTVSDVMVETMVNWGLSHVFGIVGHSNLGFADAMRKAEERGDLTFIGVRHEGAAAFAATAFGKLTGRAAGCFGIAGPGSTNLLTGLYDAKEDRAPVLALSGQVPSSVKGRRRLPGHGPRGCVQRGRPLQRDRPRWFQPCRAGLACDEDSHRRTRRGPPHLPGRDSAHAGR